MVDRKLFGRKGSNKLANTMKTSNIQCKEEKRIISEGLLFLAEGVYCYLLSNSTAVYNKEVQSRESVKEEC